MKKIFSLALFLFPFESFSITENELKEPKIKKPFTEKKKITFKDMMNRYQFQVKPEALSDKDLQRLKDLELINLDNKTIKAKL